MNKSGRRTTAEGERLHKAIHPFYMAKHEYNGPAIRDLIEIALATVRAEGHRAGMEKAAGMCRVEAKACQDAGESFVQSISDDWRDGGSMHIQAGLALDKIAAAILAAAEEK